MRVYNPSSLFLLPFALVSKKHLDEKKPAEKFYKFNVKQT